MTPQNTAGGIADGEFLDDLGVVQAPPRQILYGFRMPMQGELVKSCGSI